ncbi:MAG TPA: DUF2304 domain-containing protein [Polyangiaceae bacterium]
MAFELDTSRYWPFVLLCVVALLTMLRLLLRGRVSLAGSISYVGFLVLFLLAAIFPRIAGEVARWMGFVLLSNFLFCMALIGLAILHLLALVTLSRTELRTIQLTQELALLEERLERAGLGRDGTNR